MRTAAFTIALSIALLAATALADVPGQISYQGILADDYGVALDTTVDMSFSIYSDSAGTNLIWGEIQPAVAVSDGIFNVMLGRVVGFGDTVFTDPLRWLGVQVGGDPEMEPRQRMASVPYALVAGSGGGTSDGDWIISSNNIYSAVPGSVGIGTSSPAAKLDIRGTFHVGADGAGHDVSFCGSGSGSRLFWDESKMALRAGRDLDGTHWSPDSVGQYSLATGYNTKALGDQSTALGYGTTARGNASTAMGRNTAASGYGSLAAGRGSVASGDYSTALGYETSASGTYSTALGYQTATSGYSSIALGQWLRAGPANYTITVGRGVHGADSLVNNVENSLMVGFNTNTPTLFVGGSDHRVGVGTSAPGEKLDVNGTARVTGFNMPTGASDGYVLTTDAAGAGTWQPTATVSDGDWTISGDDIYSEPSGNVGIGTSDPLAKLHVEEDSTSDLMRLRQAGQTKFIVRNDGNVGIGSLTPLYKLEVVGDAGFSEHIYHNGDVDTYLRFTTDQIDLHAGDVQMITADEDAQDAVVINEGGTDVDFRVESASDENALVVRGSDGNVGIGTASPDSARLHVASSGGYAVYGGQEGVGTYGYLGGDGYGVYGQNGSNGTIGYMGSSTVGVYGEHASSGNYGILGESSNGVYGYSHKNNGIQARSDSGNAVRAVCDAGAGLYASSQTRRAVIGISSDSTGVWGQSSLSIGVYGQSNTGTGVCGESNATTMAIYGRNTGSYFNYGYGVYGEAGGLYNYGYGVYGKNTSFNTYGYLGGKLYGVYGYSDTSYAAYFGGDVYVTGSINKAACSFVIDHPLDPENKLLRYNCIESPEHLLIYRGKVRLDVRGQARVEMPQHFKALVKEDEATVTLTPVGKPFLTGYEWLSGQSGFQAYGDPGREVSWVVYADRDDPVIRQLARPVEEDKGPDNKLCDRGELLYPTAYGYPESMGKDYKEQEEMKRHEQQALR